MKTTKFIFVMVPATGKYTLGRLIPSKDRNETLVRPISWYTKQDGRFIRYHHPMGIGERDESRALDPATDNSMNCYWLGKYAYVKGNGTERIFKTLEEAKLYLALLTL